jgi:basic amino acid/polyamine antiporter, APA family
VARVVNESGTATSVLATPSVELGRIVPLRGEIGHFQYLALGFGTIIGSAWVILMGSWLTKAGPGGTIVGFLCAGAVMIVIGACYAELTTQIPEAGSEFIYARRVYGRETAFVVGWFLALYLVCVTIFEGLALAWVVDVVFPATIKVGAQGALGAPVAWTGITVSVTAALVILGLNYRGAQLAVVAHSILTYGFLAIVMIVVLVLLLHSSLHNALPAFATTNGSPWWLGSAAIFAFGAYALTGFQTIPQAIEERSEHISLRAIAFVMVGSIVAAVIFYCFIVFSVSIARPWRALAATPFPVVTAAAFLPHGQLFVAALLVATAASLLKTWNGIFMMAARLFVALARAGFVPAGLARLHPRYRSPASALGIVAAFNIGGLFLGKAAVQPIADMAAMMLTLAYLLCCATVLRLRRQGSVAQFRVPGGAPVIWSGAIGATAMAAAAFVSPFWEQPGTIPLEWRFLGIWSLLGAIVWFAWVRRAQEM